jgi:hypothetical protein
LPFHPSVFPTPKRWAGPMGRGSWALTLPRVPGSRMGFNSTDYWRLPWVSPSQGIPATVLLGPSPELLPRAFASRVASDRACRRLGVSIDSRLAPSDSTGKPNEPDRTTLTGSLHQYDPEHARRPAPGLFDSPLAASCIAADRPTIFGICNLALPELSGRRLRCRTSATSTSWD